MRVADRTFRREDKIKIRQAAKADGCDEADFVAIEAIAKDDGRTILMRRAFDPQGDPLTDRRALAAERKARSALFAGAIGSCKNSQHRKVDLNDLDEAAEIMMLACHLLRIVTDRSSVFS